MKRADAFNASLTEISRSNISHEWRAQNPRRRLMTWSRESIKSRALFVFPSLSSSVSVPSIFLLLLPPCPHRHFSLTSALCYESKWNGTHDTPYNSSFCASSCPLWIKCKRKALRFLKSFWWARARSRKCERTNESCESVSSAERANK